LFGLTSNSLANSLIRTFFFIIKKLHHQDSRVFYNVIDLEPWTRMNNYSASFILSDSV
jgi:hypothetical protein